jgi:hypothetical protein
VGNENEDGQDMAHFLGVHGAPAEGLDVLEVSTCMSQDRTYVLGRIVAQMQKVKNAEQQLYAVQLYFTHLRDI